MRAVQKHIPHICQGLCVILIYFNTWLAGGFTASYHCVPGAKNGESLYSAGVGQTETKCLYAKRSTGHAFSYLPLLY